MRQGALIAPLIEAQIAMGCAGILAMPNTKPPAARLFEADGPDGYASLEAYLGALHAGGGDAFEEIIVPLYLTKDTCPTMIEKGAKSGLLRACKYYPPHGTTGAEFGAPFEKFMENGVFEALQDHGIILCVHGEAHSLSPTRYFDQKDNAEDLFYRESMPALLRRFPRLKIACEHVTTQTAVDFVKKAGAHVAASVTPQHLLYTVGDLLKGLKYHLYCLPLPKFEKDRAALRAAVTDPQNTRFYAGTDSAPHSVKATDCGCAAGCFTGGIAPQLYAQAFEEAGVNLAAQKGQKALSAFLCQNGRNFYNLPAPTGRIILTKQDSPVDILPTPEGPLTPLPLGLGRKTIPWRLDVRP